MKLLQFMTRQRRLLQFVDLPQTARLDFAFRRMASNLSNVTHIGNGDGDAYPLYNRTRVRR